MEKEFIPYEQALALKELGFDEQCLALYDLDGKITIEFVNWKNAKNRKSNYLIATPLYQQAFRWFRKKYGLQSYINPELSFSYNNPKYTVIFIKTTKNFLKSFNQMSFMHIWCMPIFLHVFHEYFAQFPNWSVQRIVIMKAEKAGCWLIG